MHRRLVYIYLLNVPSFSSRYFNKIKRASRLGRFLALSLEILRYMAHSRAFFLLLQSSPGEREAWLLYFYCLLNVISLLSFYATSSRCHVLVYSMWWWHFSVVADRIHNVWMLIRPEFFYYLIYGNFFSDLGSGGRKKNKKSSENDQLTGHFQSFFFNISRKKRYV